MLTTGPPRTKYVVAKPTPIICLLIFIRCFLFTSARINLHHKDSELSFGFQQWQITFLAHTLWKSGALRLCHFTYDSRQQQMCTFSAVFVQKMIKDPQKGIEICVSDSEQCAVRWRQESQVTANSQSASRPARSGRILRWPDSVHIRRWPYTVPEAQLLSQLLSMAVLSLVLCRR